MATGIREIEIIVAEMEISPLKIDVKWTHQEGIIPDEDYTEVVLAETATADIDAYITLFRAQLYKYVDAKINEMDAGDFADGGASI